MNPTHQIQKHPRFRISIDVDVLDDTATIRRLPLENISLGGMFIRDSSPPAPGALVRLRLYDPTREAPLGVSARVVHVIDAPRSALEGHPPGMGVQYQNVSAASVEKLRVFVDALVRDASPTTPHASGARFVDASTVELSADKTRLRALWQQGLRVGRLFVEGSPPASMPTIGAPVLVRVGALRFQAVVVQVQPGVGAALLLREVSGPAWRALTEFLEEGATELRLAPRDVSGPPLANVLEAARRLFAGVEAGDGLAALGLAATAGEVEVKTRVESLKRIFSVPQLQASPPQAARIDSALRTVTRIEPGVLARVAALRREAELVPTPAAPITPSPVGDEDKPGATDQQAAIAAAKAAKAAKAAGALQQAEVFVAGLGMNEDAKRLAREALRLSQARELRLRSLAVLARAGAVDEAIEVGEQLLAENATDAQALRALTHLYERIEHWERAARTAAALLQLRSGDAELLARVRRLNKLAGR